ncbi:MAG: hypothetical protein M0D55_18165 [Elusimicrobiota bacterium]|nr:MAG: hypothetical protein M0D55_18165 [Elusimicrobiota bacterium]
MIISLSAFLLLFASASSAQTLEDAYAQAEGRIVPASRTCWSRGESAAADAAGMPKTVCIDSIKVEGKIASISGMAVLAGGAQREPLTGARPVSGAAGSSWTTVFHWEAGKGEFDEESVFQVSFKLENGAVVPGSLKPIAFHQCPERGCSYACGVTSVEFK